MCKKRRDISGLYGVPTQKTVVFIAAVFTTSAEIQQSTVTQQLNHRRKLILMAIENALKLDAKFVS
jgi:hypothetical protein